ncbi:hypothetical protein J6V85_00005, partial [Candidatus Saccharibacteria bacterium]|nr:hypothetical protein [Candidatus Saccharibacteria bacterium]
TIFRDEATMLAPISLTPPSGKVFAGWNTAADGSGTSYTNQQSVTNIAADGGSITLYAQWVVSICAGHENELYCKVAAMNKGTQTAANLRVTITTPTSSNPTTDTSNSGVYEYDASVFGVSSDASNDYPIYYYRGVLDSDLDGTSSTYGSNGNGAYYPNYVKLGNTCWRIFRTTGSGGVKMIYNGLYSSGTNTNSCANAQSDARVDNLTYNGNTTRQVSHVGYTYNASIDSSTDDNTPTDVVFGGNANFAELNTTDSPIKNYIENTWFVGENGLSLYESMLEPSAGYCNDRSIYSNKTDATLMTTIAPFYTGTEAYFGAYIRNRTDNRTLSLSCPRGEVDLYTTVSATGGNKQLDKPVALITADEVALSGSGISNLISQYNTYSSVYNYNSFLRSGSGYYLLSPYYIYSGGLPSMYVLSGYSTNGLLYDFEDVRPVISLVSGVIPSGGSGTATDPWVVEVPL